MYEIRAYYDNNFRGLEDSYKTNNFDNAVIFAHSKLMQGCNVIFENTDTGIKKQILSDYYTDNIDNFDGEFLYTYKDFE